MTVRFGLVGTGYWAREVHAAGLRAHPEVELVGVWGRESDYEARFAEVDAVAFAVPPAVQAQIAVRAARAGKHLLLEKPIALELDAADRLVAAVEESGVSSLVFFTQRFVPVWEDWLNSVAATRPVGGRADWLSAQSGSDSPYAGSLWRREHGALWDVGPHQVAQLITALGPVADIAGVRGEGDLVHLVLTHEGGATSRMSLSLTMPAGTTRIQVEFYGEGGWMLQPEHSRDVADAYARAVSELVANIGAGETRHRCDVRFGREVVEVLTRAEESLA
ncbi:MAG: Gfo/Idh/MocA family protein [Marmoricola sp.]